MLHFLWSPATRHYVSCHPLPDPTREHGGTGAWETRRWEISPTSYWVQPCTCTEAAETEHGTSPKGQKPLLTAGREPAASLLLLEPERGFGSGTPHLSVINRRVLLAALGQSAFRMGESQDCGRLLSTGSCLTHTCENYSMSHCKRNSKDQGRI